MSAKQATNDKLQWSVATYLRCYWVSNQIKKKFIAESANEKKKLKSVNIWQSYNEDCGCLMHFAHIANTLLTGEESARDNHAVACNFAKYSPIKKYGQHSAIHIS